jgi:uncharacterized protein (TIGR02246 family)
MLGGLFITTREDRMKLGTTLSLSALALVTMFAIAAAPARPGPDDEIAAIKKNTVAFGKAWNNHDAKAIAGLWAKDGDLIDPWGVTSVGREAVEKFFAQEHAGTGKLSQSTYDVKADSVRLITSDVAMEDWQVVLTGLSGPDGKAMGPQMHRVVVVLKKDGGRWQIAAARPGIPGPVGDAGASHEKTAEPKK